MSHVVPRRNLGSGGQSVVFREDQIASLGPLAFPLVTTTTRHCSCAADLLAPPSWIPYPPSIVSLATSS